MFYLRYLCLCIVVSNRYCVVFLFWFSSSYVPYVATISLDCQFCIAPSVFSNVYFHPVSYVPYVATFAGLSIFDCSFGIL